MSEINAIFAWFGLMLGADITSRLLFLGGGKDLWSAPRATVVADLVLNAMTAGLLYYAWREVSR